MKSNWNIAENMYDDVIKQILHNRGIQPENVEAFLRPDFNKDLFDSELLPDFQIFKSRIDKAIANKEKVGIFADYDADGIPGAAFLYKSLIKLGLEPEVYIPSRDEGYGLNRNGLDNLIRKGCTLIITVDLGIKNYSEAKYCKERNIDLIITDHHLPEKQKPEACAVINPKLAESKYPFKELSGAGVVYKLIYGLKNYYIEIDEKFLKWNIDLIAISTISDVVPLISENRTIASFGLLVLKKTKNIGLKAMCKRANIASTTLGAYHVGFMIGPRLNAPGRLDDALKSFLLLTTAEKKEADLIAQQLEEENQTRQELMDQLLKEADEILTHHNLQNDKIIILRGDWAKGIIGPSASRLSEKYCRPVIILSEDGDLLTGSARSINDINIIEILRQCSGTLIKFGGHKGAAGLSLEKKNYKSFVNKISEVSQKMISEDDLQKNYRADMAVDFSALTFDLSKELRQLEPFGMGNPKPIFATSEAFIHEPKFVGSDQKHLSAYIEHKNKRIKSIYFNCQNKDLKHQDKINLLYSMDEEEWNGRHYLKISVIDIEANI